MVCDFTKLRSLTPRADTTLGASLEEKERIAALDLIVTRCKDVAVQPPGHIRTRCRRCRVTVWAPDDGGMRRRICTVCANGGSS